MGARQQGWWQKNFFPDFRPLFDMISPRQTNAEARYIIEKMNLRPGRKFLDCPCGIGRIALPLAKKGIRVTGVDITTSYLEELQSKAKRRGLKIECIERDMRRIDFNEKFDAAGNLGTSFGYFENQSDDLLTLKKAYRALKPGGKFLLHVTNRDWIIAHFVPRDWSEIKGLKVIQKRTFDYEKSIIRSTWVFARDGREQDYQVDIRVYSCHEIIKMFARTGFIDIEAFGSTAGEPIDRNQRMMFIFGTRPKASGR